MWPILRPSTSADRTSQHRDYTNWATKTGPNLCEYSTRVDNDCASTGRDVNLEILRLWMRLSDGELLEESATSIDPASECPSFAEAAIQIYDPAILRPRPSNRDFGGTANSVLRKR